MAFCEIELSGHKRVLDAWLAAKRPPPNIRAQLDLGYRIKGQSVEIFEVRPRFKHPTEKLEHPVAKATWNNAKGVWHIYWQRADLKWHRYEPLETVGTLDRFLKAVSDDKHACFFG